MARTPAKATPARRAKVEATPARRTRTAAAPAPAARKARAAKEEPVLTARQKRLAAKAAAAAPAAPARKARAAKAEAPARKARGSRKMGRDLPATKVKPEQLMYQINVIGKTVVELKGQLTSISVTELVLRHKKERSSKLMFSTFQIKDVVSVFGEEGEQAIVKINKLTTIDSYKGKVETLEGGLIQVTTLEGESIILNPASSANVEIELTAMEEDVLGAGKKERVSRKAKAEVDADEDDGEDEDEDDGEDEDDADDEDEEDWEE